MKIFIRTQIARMIGAMAIFMLVQPCSVFCAPSAPENGSRRAQLDQCAKQAKEMKLTGPQFGQFMRTCLMQDATATLAQSAEAAASSIYVESTDLSVGLKPLTKTSAPH